MEEPQKSYLILAVALIITVSFGFWLLFGNMNEPVTGRASIQLPTTCGGTTPCDCGHRLIEPRVLDENDRLTGCVGYGLIMGAEDVTLDCNGNSITGAPLPSSINDYSTDAVSAGVYNDGYSGITVKNCNIRDFATGIYMLNSHDHTVDNNLLTYNGLSEGPTGLHMQNVNDSLIKDNIIDSNNLGVYFAGSNNNILQDNTITNNPEGGVSFDTCSENTITGGEIAWNNKNEIRMGGIDIRSRGNTGNTIRGVSIHNNTRTGIYVSGDHGIVIEQNTLHNNKPIAQIYLEVTDDARIEDNDITATPPAIPVSAGTQEASASYGIEIIASNSAQIIDNTVSMNGYSGIFISGEGFSSDHIIRGNTVTENNFINPDPDCSEDSCGAGIRLYMEDNCLIENNVVSDNYYHGISLFNSPNNTVTGNTVEYNNNNQIRVDARLSGGAVSIQSDDPYLGGRNTISKNTITMNSGSSVPVALTSTKIALRIGSAANTITDNTITNAGTVLYGTYGIDVHNDYLAPEHNSFSKNDVSGFEIGFYAYSACGFECSVTNFTIDNDKYFNNIMGIFYNGVEEGGVGAVSYSPQAIEMIPVIKNTRAYDNCDVGAVILSASVDITDTDFTKNHAEGLSHCEASASSISDFSITRDLKYGGIYLEDGKINLENGDFIDNNPWGMFGYTPSEPAPVSVIQGKITWGLTEDVVCRNNDINITGNIVPRGGSITATNCNIWLNGKLLDTAAGQQGRGQLILKTKASAGGGAVGGQDVGVRFEAHTSNEYGLPINITFYNQNPGGNGFLLTGIGKWLDIVPDPGITFDWMIIKVYYTDSEIRGMTESSLRLEYYNATSNTWEKFDPPKGGVNTTGNYVWANVTHFSIYGVGGTPKPSSDRSGGSSGPYEKDIGDIFEGVSFQSKIDETVYFQKDDNGYTLVVQAITPIGTTINIGGTSVTLQAGMMQDLDLNGNGQTDAILKVTSVMGSIVNMFLEQVSETGAVPAPEPVKIPVEKPKTPVEKIVDEQVELPDPIEPVEMAKPNLVQQPTVVEEAGLSMPTIILLVVGFLVVAGLIVFTMMHKKEPPISNEKLDIPDNVDDIPAPTIRQAAEKPPASEPTHEESPKPEPQQSVSEGDIPKPDEIPKAFGEEPKQPEVQPPQS